MNRAERRRLKKHGCTNGLKPTLTTDHYIHYYSLALADALYCEGIESNKIIEIFKKIENTVDCLASGHINAQDLETMCMDEIGINFVRGRGNI